MKFISQKVKGDYYKTQTISTGNTSFLILQKTCCLVLMAVSAPVNTTQIGPGWKLKSQSEVKKYFGVSAKHACSNKEKSFL